MHDDAYYFAGHRPWPAPRLPARAYRVAVGDVRWDELIVGIDPVTAGSPQVGVLGDLRGMLRHGRDEPTDATLRPVGGAG